MKKILSAILVVTLLLCFAGCSSNRVVIEPKKEANLFNEAGLLCVLNSQGKWVFIDGNGKEVVKTDYTNFVNYNKSTLESLNVGIFRNDTKIALLNAKGEELAVFNNDNTINYTIWGFDESDVSVISKTINLNQNPQMLCGIINSKGEMVVDFIYKSIGSFSKEGYARFQTKENSNKYGLLDKTGKIICKEEYDDRDLPDFSFNGLAVKKDKNENGFVSYGYVNTSGEWVIKPQFKSASKFQENGFAIVKLEDGYSVINDKGEIITNNQYESISGFENGVAEFYQGDKKYGAIDQKGKEIAKDYEDLEVTTDGFIKAKKDGKYGLLTSEGKTYVNFEFEQIGAISANGFVAVKQNGKWGYVTKGGKFVIDPVYSKAEEFKENGYAVVAKDGKYGLINEKGETVIETEYKKAVNFNVNGIAALKVDRSWKFVDTQNKEISKIDTEALWYYLGDGYYITQTLDGSLHTILKDGNVIAKNIKTIAINLNANK